MRSIGRTLPLLLHMCMLATVLWLHTKEVASTQVCAQRSKLIAAIVRIDAFEIVWQRSSNEPKSEKFLEFLESKSNNSYLLIKTDLHGNSCVLDGELNSIDNASQILSRPKNGNIQKNTNERIQSQHQKIQNPERQSETPSHSIPIKIGATKLQQHGIPEFDWCRSTHL